MYTNPDVTDLLQHHGVKGMRWGRRKDQGNSAVGKAAVSEDAARAQAAATKAKSSGVHSLSNQELAALTNRLGLEQRLSQLEAAPAKKKQSAGSKFAQDLLVNVAKQQVTKLANDAAAKHVSKAFG